MFHDDIGILSLNKSVPAKAYERVMVLEANLELVFEGCERHSGNSDLFDRIHFSGALASYTMDSPIASLVHQAAPNKLFFALENSPVVLLELSYGCFDFGSFLHNPVQFN